jgi:hypothetical protein
MPVSINGNTGITFPDGSVQPAAASPYVNKNRIINGDFRIDQRNAGASVTPTNTQYIADRFRCQLSQASKYSAQQSTVAPVGFTNSMLITSLSSYSITSTDFFDFRQIIEGFNTADLAWGTANAQTVTLSFWVRSSLTGTFGGSLKNGANDRSYPFSYAISTANTWEQKSITIAGDTTGTWLTTNATGISVIWGIGVGSTFSGTAGAWASAKYLSATGATSVVGTNGATFYITGVQLEVGTSATPFERRLYNQELANCQRYYYRFNPAGSGSNTLGIGFADSTTSAQITHFYPVPMRTNPTALEQSGTAGNYAIRYTGASVATCNSVPTFSDANVTNATFNLPVASGLTGGQAIAGRAVNTSAWLAWSAEL